MTRRRAGSSAIIRSTSRARPPASSRRTRSGSGARAKRRACRNSLMNHGLKGAMISAVDLVRGVGLLAGWDRIDVPGATGYLDTDYAAKGRTGIEALKRPRPRLRPCRGARRGEPRGPRRRQGRGARADRPRHRRAAPPGARELRRPPHPDLARPRDPAPHPRPRPRLGLLGDGRHRPGRLGPHLRRNLRPRGRRPDVRPRVRVDAFFSSA